MCVCARQEVCCTHLAHHITLRERERERERFGDAIAGLGTANLIDCEEVDHELEMWEV